MKVKNSVVKRYLGGGICPTLRANKTSSGVIEVMADVNVIGSLESKFESTNRIYDVGGVQSNIEYNARWQSRAENS